MIPRAHITSWRRVAPWPTDAQVEQDLILSRALVELFSRPTLAGQLAFRGGTALHKLFFEPPGRYSEDIDLVRRQPGPIKPIASEIRTALDPWLGKPKWRAGESIFTLTYRFETTFAPVTNMRVKIEVNTREHDAVDGFVGRSIAVDNPWFSGEADVSTYTLPELLGTKLRALYQRKKGRDLFDLDLAMDHPDFNAEALVGAFQAYMALGGHRVSRAQFEANMAAKMRDPAFVLDVPELLRTGLTYDPAAAWAKVREHIVSRLPGEPWKGADAGD